MAEPLHWLTCQTCGKHVGYVIGRTGRTRLLSRCGHLPPFGRLTVARARELVKTGVVALTTQERLFA